MMRFNWKTELFPLVCITAMFILAAIAWPNAPDQIPIHWGADGEPDNYGGRFSGLLMAPLIAAGVYGLFYILPKIDPKRANYSGFWGRYLFIRNLLIVLLFCIKLITFLWVMGIGIDTGLTVMIVVGLVFMVLGNYMSKLRPNWFIGIKTPWTLTSEESWNKTHRWGGRFFVLVGLGMVIAAPIDESWLFTFLGIASGVGLVGLFYYSWRVWKNDPAAVPVGSRMTEMKKEGKR